VTRRTLTAATGGAVTFPGVGLFANPAPPALARPTVPGAALDWVARFDPTQRRIPNPIDLPAAWRCAALILAAGAAPSLLAGLATSLVLLIGSLRWAATLGMGDIKLALLLALGLDGDPRRALARGLAVAVPMALFLTVGALRTPIA
jgi:hypothetical protein